MAFQQFDIVPSFAPVAKRAEAPARPVPVVRRPKLPAKTRFSAGRIASVAMAAAGIGIIGYAVTVAVESLALGVMAADFAFLAVAAAWTAVSGR
jgi:hypothetical protein